MSSIPEAMKTTAKIIAMIFLLSLGTWLMPQKAQAYPYVGISFQVFYDDLSPYGTWVNSPDYGYVWVPNAGPDFYPYGSNGYWVYSDFGWTWVSNYPWGWAPFHYGRWYWDNWYGWIWVPGTDWGPGWVTWRVCDGYYGWAPIAPGFSFSMYWGWNMNIPPAQWIFVHDRDFCRQDIDHYYIDRHDNDRLYHNSRFMSTTQTDPERNVRYFSGPRVTEVSKATRTDIRPIAVRDNSRPGEDLRNGRLEIYRPAVKETADRGSRPAPANVAPYRERGNNTGAASRNEGTMRSGSQNRAPAPVIRNEQPRKENAAPVMRNETPKKENSAPVMRNESPKRENSAPVMRNEPPKRENSAPVMRNEQPRRENPAPAVKHEQQTRPNNPPAMRENKGQSAPQRHAPSGNQEKRGGSEHPHK